MNLWVLLIVLSIGLHVTQIPLMFGSQIVRILLIVSLVWVIEDDPGSFS